MAPKRGPVLATLGAPAAALFGLAVARRNARYDRGVGVTRAPMPVVCVGNLTVGGVGKSPMVRWVVGRLQQAGHAPAIVLRGFGARAGVSDEAEEHRALTPGVPVVVNPDRAAAVRELADRPAAERPSCVVLDDGFQHRRLARDLDVVLIDARRNPWRDRLLPAGRLREPPASLARAGVVVLTHTDRAGPDDLAEIERRVARAAPGVPIARSRHAWARLVVEARDGAELAESVEWLSGRRVFVACGIGSPGQFMERVRAAGAHVVGTLAVRDHAPFPRGRLARAVRDAGADAIVSTLKDRPRLREALPARGWARIVYPVVETDVFAGADALERAILTAAGPAPGREPPR
ncbi:MAG: tetraacyldisaccharide 4'-kinase [Planctomycetota bacterium]|nr:MAG: tetraacyldisaccharide 4'-kinase [Planctomycetota bacterium]